MLTIRLAHIAWKEETSSKGKRQYFETEITQVDDVKNYAFLYVHAGIIKNHGFSRHNNDYGKFSPPRRQLGSAAKNNINAHRLKPCWSYTVSGDKRNNSM